jgi:hypothetical protein
MARLGNFLSPSKTPGGTLVVLLGVFPLKIFYGSTWKFFDMSLMFDWWMATLWLIDGIYNKIYIFIVTITKI